MVHDELVGLLVHQGHQFLRLPDNGLPVAPGKDSGKKPGYFNILPFAEPMGYTHRIVSNKGGPVVFCYFSVQEIPERFIIQWPELNLQ